MEHDGQEGFDFFFGSWAIRKSPSGKTWETNWIMEMTQRKE